MLANANVFLWNTKGGVLQIVDTVNLILWQSLLTLCNDKLFTIAYVQCVKICHIRFDESGDAYHPCDLVQNQIRISHKWK